MGFNFKKKFRGTLTFRSENPIIPEVRFFEPPTSPDQVTGTKKKSPPKKSHGEQGGRLRKKEMDEMKWPVNPNRLQFKIALDMTHARKTKITENREIAFANEHSMLKNEMTRKLKT